MPKTKNNNYIRQVPYLRNSVTYDFWYRPFCHCFEIFVVWAVRGGKRENCSQAFMQTLLSTAVLCQRLSFFTVCVNNYLHEVLPRWAPKWNFLNFRSPYCWNIYFWHFLWLQKHSLNIVFLLRQQFFLEL